MTPAQNLVPGGVFHHELLRTSFTAFKYEPRIVLRSGILPI